jgi:hypothetical protein
VPALTVIVALSDKVLGGVGKVQLARLMNVDERLVGTFVSDESGCRGCLGGGGCESKDDERSEHLERGVKLVVMMFRLPIEKRVL